MNENITTSPMRQKPRHLQRLVRPAVVSWVACRTRMPSQGEDDHPLLVFTKWGTIYIGLKSWRHGSKPDYWEVNAGERLEIEDVTHWALLPPGPNAKLRDAAPTLNT